MRIFLVLVLYFAAPPSFATVKPAETGIDLACKKMQSFFADTLETCKNQKIYKKFVEELEEVDCPRFTHSFFIVLRTVLENDPFKKDSTCFDKETFDSNLADSLVNELEVKYNKEFLQLAKYSKLSRESFMKLPLNLFSYKTLMSVGKSFPADSETRKKIMVLALDKLSAAHSSKKIAPDDEKTFQMLEAEAGLKRKSWTSLGFYGVSGCKKIQKAFIVVPEETATDLKADKALKNLLDAAALQPVGGEIDPPFAKPSPAQIKNLNDLMNSESISSWAQSEKVDSDRKAFQNSIVAKNINWFLLRSLIAKAVKTHEHQIDLSSVARCTSN